jgi:N6-adenosine-specific RNA methylase IME4
MPRKGQSLVINPAGEKLLEGVKSWSAANPRVERSALEWANYGILLARIEREVPFSIGDWWNRGERWGDRVAIVTAPGWTGPSYKTCRNYGSVAARFDVSRRRDNVTFSIYDAIAHLDREAQESKLAQISETLEQTGKALSSRDVRQLVKRERRTEREQELSVVTEQAGAKLGHKLYGVILADPPWDFRPYSAVTGMDRAAQNHYGCMPTEDICLLRPPAARDCVLFLWRTGAMQDDAAAVMKAWGFQTKSEIIWGKNKTGLGYWVRNKHEVLMIGTRGQPVAPAPGTQPDSLIMANVTRHSEKPPVFHELIESMYPTTAKIEMFARKFRDGWDAFGNEVADRAVA